MTLTVQDFEYFEQRLKGRRQELREAILDALIQSDDKAYGEFAGRVRDEGDDALAELTVGLNISAIEAEVTEVRDIEAALERLQDGSYGECIDCGEPIPKERLEVYPTAKRCHPCQARHEQERSRGGKDITPSL